MKKQNFKYYAAGAVSLITFIVYLPSLQNAFVLWDDEYYVFENLHIRSFDLNLFKWAFFDFYASNWHPLTWISHALDYAVWGLNPTGHHLTNNILHAVNTFLVVLLVVRLLEVVNALSLLNSSRPPLTLRGGAEGGGVISIGGFSDKGTLIAAATTGLLFGIHPLHVESVAWVAERKDLLSALFFLLSIMMYARHFTPPSPYENHNSPLFPSYLKRGRGGAEGRYFRKGWRSRGSYLLSLLFFTLALLSKPMAVSLPLVLLILDWYPFENIRSLKTFLNAVINKAPFITLSIGSSVLTMMAQKNAMRLMDIVPWQARVLSSAYALFAYIGKMLAPVGLSPFYPYSGNVYLLSPAYFIAIVLVIGLTAACLVIGKRQKIWLSLWVYYVVTLVPVLGIVQVGRQSMADRYAYLPSIAPFLITGILVAWAYRKIKEPGLGIKLACASSVLCLVLCLAYLTFKQIGIWNNSVNFWSYVIQKEPEVPFAYYGRGLALYEMGQTNKALEDYGKAIAIDPSYSKAYATRGFVFEKRGEFDKAVADYSKALALDPFDAQAYNNRGVIFEKMGEFDKAVADYDKVVALNPLDSQSYNNRGVVFEKMGRFDKAITDYDKAIALNLSNAALYYNRGNVYDEMGGLDRAIKDYDKAISLDPSDSHAFNNRGLVFEKMGEFDKAIADYDKAIVLDPSNTDAVYNRRNALENKFRKLIKTKAFNSGVN
jgi:tetratricopeptide (TPR) repeat protein